MKYILFGLIILVTHFLEGITGFGCTVLALPFGILLFGAHISVPVLIVLGLILCLYIVLISWKDIVWKELIIIVLFVGLGVPFGYFIFTSFNEKLLTLVLGIFMILISLRGLYISFSKQVKTYRLNKYTSYLILFLGGCIHGAFSSGGPLVIIYASKVLKNKNNFRATLCMLWVVLNTFLFTSNVINGVMTTVVWKTLFFSLPFLTIGAFLGNWAHHHIKDTIFTKLVYCVLFVSGVFMFV